MKTNAEYTYISSEFSAIYTKFFQKIYKHKYRHKKYGNIKIVNDPSNEIAPFGKVAVGDKIAMKESGGLVLGEFTVKNVRYYSDLNTDSKALKEIQSFGKQICSDIDPNFWETRKSARYATLIDIANPTRYTKPRPCLEKKSKDRRGWVVIEKCEIGN